MYMPFSKVAIKRSRVFNLQINNEQRNKKNSITTIGSSK